MGKAFFCNFSVISKESTTSIARKKTLVSSNAQGPPTTQVSYFEACPTKPHPLITNDPTKYLDALCLEPGRARLLLWRPEIVLNSA